ncbi:hypothetical protein BMR06_03975 [Methylococcaceae bacterium HT5]|nr:hypothetical protein BMR06_03975 [Methylococcaceae bacterium HT5]
MSRQRILIIGGVAGGATCAVRIRRLYEHCEIIIFEMGSYVSFANCGLPYFIGDVIVGEEKLLVATPALFENRFNIRVCTDPQVLSIAVSPGRDDSLQKAQGNLPIRSAR